MHRHQHGVRMRLFKVPNANGIQAYFGSKSLFAAEDLPGVSRLLIAFATTLCAHKGRPRHSGMFIVHTEEMQTFVSSNQ